MTKPASRGRPCIANLCGSPVLPLWMGLINELPRMYLATPKEFSA